MFLGCEHDNNLVLGIYSGLRPEISKGMPKVYVDLMEKCWDSNPDNRPNAIEVEELLNLFDYSYLNNESSFKRIIEIEKEQQHYEIKKQFKEVDEHKEEILLTFGENKKSTIHPEAVYTSRLLNILTIDLPKYQTDGCFRMGNY